MLSSFVLPSYAKINLHLRVIGRREDGYHELCTVFQTVTLNDTISFSPLNGMRLTVSGGGVPADEDNLILKAADALLARFHVETGASIHLEKRIPSPGGLGGGSSNAATALMGLTRLWGITPGQEGLMAIAASLGSDVPFFLTGGTALGTGRGESIEPLEDASLGPMLIVTPPVRIPTPAIFARLGVANLTKREANRNLQVCRKEAMSIVGGPSAMKNDFQPLVFELYPEVRRVHETLLSLGAYQAMLSGSGASVFAVFDKEETRHAALKALDNEVNWRKFAVAAISRDSYREDLSS